MDRPSLGMRRYRRLARSVQHHCLAIPAKRQIGHERPKPLDAKNNAARYERAGERKAYRAGHYDRSLTAKAGRLGLKVPKLKGEVSNPRSSSATDGARKASTRRYLDRSRLDDKLAEAN